MRDILDNKPFARLIHLFKPESSLVRTWQLQGGISAQVTAMEIRNPDGTTSKLVVRRHGEGDLKRNPNIAADEFKLLAILHRADLPVPAPVYVESTVSIFPTPCLVVEFLEGNTEFSPPDIDTHVHLLANQLSDIHRTDRSAHDVSFLPDQHKMISTKLHERPETLDESLSEGQIRDTLEAIWPTRAINQPVLLHGDFWPGNLLWQDGELTGIIDWEDAAVGDPLYDLAIARLESLWAFGHRAMELFTERYMRLMPTVNFNSLPLWDLVAALRPAFEIAEWAGNASAERKMRDLHRKFVTRALDALKIQGLPGDID